MAVFAIADLHLSLGTEKPMDIFAGWDDYTARLEANWSEIVAPGDTVVVPGDISWAMTLDEAADDFRFIDELPGKKIILKGNHDYWWTTRRKMDAWLEKNGFSSICILHNDAYLVEGLAICGSRGWMREDGEEPDQKVYNREVERLRASLNAATQFDDVAERVVFLHYPPIFMGYKAEEIIALLHEYGVRRCFYGHIHGKGIKAAFNGSYADIEYRLISADALGFKPFLLHC